MGVKLNAVFIVRCFFGPDKGFFNAFLPLLNPFPALKKGAKLGARPKEVAAKTA
jgi:hypothetical protein